LLVLGLAVGDVEGKMLPVGFALGPGEGLVVGAVLGEIPSVGATLGKDDGTLVTEGL
jgi:hypothetical protein